MHKETAEQLIKLTQDGYEKIARPFSATRHSLWKDFTLFDQYVKDGMRVLDIGCGNGRLYEYLKNKNIAYIGIDSNAQFITSAAERFKNDPRAQFIHLDMESLTQALFAQPFDLIFCIASVQHLPTNTLRRRALVRMRSIVRPEGMVIMLNWNLWRPTRKKKSVWRYGLDRLAMSSAKWYDRYGFFKKDIGWRDIITGWRSGDTTAPLYYHVFTIRELKWLCRQAGFTVRKAYYIRQGIHAHWWDAHNSFIICQNEKTTQ